MMQGSMLGKIPTQGIAAAVLIAVLGGVTAVHATVLVDATWNSTVNLSYAAGGILAPTTETGGVGLAPGKFGQGVSLASANDRLSYSAVGNFNKTEGTISFWWQAPYSAANMPSDLRIFSVGTSSDQELVTIRSYGYNNGLYMIGTADEQALTLAYAPIPNFNAGDWLYFAFEWNTASGIDLWVGSSGSLGPAINSVTGAYTPLSGSPTSVNIGDGVGPSWGTLSTYGVWDDLYISDTLLYGLTSTITVPSEALTVPEPSIWMLMLVGGAGLFTWWRRRLDRQVS